MGGAVGPRSPSPAPTPLRSPSVQLPAPPRSSRVCALLGAPSRRGGLSPGPGRGRGAEGNWPPVTRSIGRLRNRGPSPLGFSAENERFVKPSAGICPPAAASPLPRGWVYSKKPTGLAELPGLATQPRVAAMPRPEREGRGPRTVPGALLGRGEAGAGTGGTGVLQGVLGRAAAGSPATLPGAACPATGCSEPPRSAGDAQAPACPSPAAPCSARAPPRSGSLRGCSPPEGLLGPAVLLPPCSLAPGRESPVLQGALTSGMCLGRAWRAATRARGHSSHSSGGCPGRPRRFLAAREPRPRRAAPK